MMSKLIQPTVNMAVPNIHILVVFVQIHLPEYAGNTLCATSDTELEFYSSCHLRPENSGDE